MKVQVWVGDLDALLDLLDVHMELHFFTLLRAVSNQALRVQEDDVLAIVVDQPDDEVRVVHVVVEERYAAMTRQITNQVQLSSPQAGVDALGERVQRFDHPLLVPVQGDGLNGDLVALVGVQQREVGVRVDLEDSELQTVAVTFLPESLLQGAQILD